MALVSCPECEVQVSDSALKCTGCGFQILKLERGFFGKLFKWVFILFNVLMTYLLFSYFGSVGEVVSTSDSEAAQTGAAIGATIGTSMIMGFWVFGDIILGLLVLFTKPKS
ncbi:hypothetical protein GCM10007978_08280 [Shewanella hanedai]|uniref:Zinc ribbon domain-containing protein n=1 Tax=Shewanella hanedai TaxID=25 RepID=A0A553JS90_SHEHA|nr:hypothetical protein [Shewanella hanedai]TRY15326.1 hypothetical protein FN961_06570 [Shewanella hanedai]GGI72814.1 hypothetical protein GCM10007978_08280 [Shewanella hanedai]